MPRFWLLKVRLAVDRLAVGPVLVPVRVTICGLPTALSVIAREALRVPGAVGANVTLIVQLPPAATELPQVLVTLKSPALAPVTCRLVMVKVLLPVLLRVMVWELLVEPTGWLL